MRETLLSVIVPIYNVEAYVEECIISILNQTYKNIEVLLMNDGSTDNSTEICRRYAKLDNRIKFYSQDNQGVVSARKNALAHIRGEYVTFVDADDFIELTFFQDMMSQVNGHDLVTSGYYNGYGLCTKFFDGIHEGEYCTESELGYLYSNLIQLGEKKEIGIIRSMWAKIYKTDLVKVIFKEIDETISIGEDGDFLYRYILKCKSIQITKLCGYHYRMREDSVMSSVNKRFLRNIDSIYNTLEPVFLNHPYRDVLLVQLQGWIAQMINQAPYYLGFPIEMHTTSYVYPELKTIAGKDVVIYGAGNVGRSYKNFFERYGVCDVKLWVDKNTNTYENMYTISKVKDVLNCKYDYIVIALKSESLATEVIKELSEIGVETDRIIWKKPLER